MPIYEYKCRSCKKIFEVFQRITEEPLTSCPDCRGSVKKLVSMSAFHLKGGGWYADGYSSSPGNGGNSSGKSTSSVSVPADKTGDKKTSGPAPSDSKSGSTSKKNQATASR
jgi:putative FmdB family regulatory protein